MNTIGVNISGNKSFASLAEELIARNSQHIHELFTELFTLCEQAQARAKKLSEKHNLREQCTALCSALTLGWRQAITDKDPPGSVAIDDSNPDKVRYLIAPFRQLGYTLGMRTIDLLIAKGAHRSCKVNGTQGPPAPGLSYDDPGRKNTPS